MGGFAIIPQKSKYNKTILHGFAKRKFDTPIKFKNLDFDILYYPKYNGISQYVTDKNNNVLFVFGTVWYKNKSFETIKEVLLNDLNAKTFNEDLISGTFTLVYFNEQNDIINILHDANAVNRIYYDDTTKIISSSWLSLVWLKKRSNNDINTNAVLENLILGFNIGSKTFINDIERIKSNDKLNKRIQYNRVKNIIDNTYIKQKHSKSIETSIAKLKKTLNSKLNGFNVISLGVSGGHDSRLLLGAIDKNLLKDNLSLFTFYKPKDKDLEIAKVIAESLEKKINIIRSNRIRSIKEQEKVFENAFHFFDGQCGTMLQYSKVDYTKEFRDKLLIKSDLHLSGVGGEIFRNYNHQPKSPLTWKFWINHFFCAGKIQSFIDNDELIENIIEEFKSLLGLDSNKIRYKDRKKFYGQIFLSDWHGIRNTIENQYSNYYSPFTDVNLINYSYQTINYHGAGGEYESRMINEISPKLASIKSEYGYNFSNIPIKIRVTNRIKCLVKLPIFSSLREIKSNSDKNVQITEFERGIFENLKTLFRNDNSNFDLFLNFKKEQVLMISYVLKSIIN